MAPNRNQADLQAAFVELVRRCPDASNRDCLPDHLTASALVITPDATAVMLGLHRKVQLWLQFGGHLEPVDGSLCEGALREAKEESGVDDLVLGQSSPVQLDRHPAPCRPDARHHLDVQFLAIAPATATPVVSSESLDVRWFAIDALPDETDDAVRRLVAVSVELMNERSRGHDR